MKIIKVSHHDFRRKGKTTKKNVKRKAKTKEQSSFLIKTYNYLNGIIKLFLFPPVFPCCHGEKVSGTMPLILRAQSEQSKGTLAATPSSDGKPVNRAEREIARETDVEDGGRRSAREHEKQIKKQL